MLKINCRICRNCDLKNSRCKLYGSDPAKAARRCADAGFANYKPVNKNLSLYKKKEEPKC